MQEFTQTSSDNSLQISCKSGSISMIGNSILQNPAQFFKPVQDWLNEYVNDPADLTEITLKFYYIDTASVQAIFDSLKILKKIKNFKEKVIVNWYFEFDDPELLEIGEIMEGRLKLSFNFIEYLREEND